MDNVALIHMKGRVYDPVLGRFTSAAPLIDGPFDSQGWNRYAYVHNRPLSATDPSGYESEEIFVYGRRVRGAVFAGGFIAGGGGIAAAGEPTEFEVTVEATRIRDTKAAGGGGGSAPQSCGDWQEQVKEFLCSQAETDDAWTDVLTSIDSGGTAADLLRPAAVASATAAGVADQLPNSQAWSFLSRELSTGLKTVARFGNVATGALFAIELSRGNGAGAFYAGLDFGVFWALSAAATAGAPITGGGSTLEAAMVGAAFYASGGSRAAVQSVLCN